MKTINDKTWKSIKRILKDKSISDADARATLQKIVEDEDTDDYQRELNKYEGK